MVEQVKDLNSQERGRAKVALMSKRLLAAMKPGDFTEATPGVLRAQVVSVDEPNGMARSVNISIFGRTKEQLGKKNNDLSMTTWLIRSRSFGVEGKPDSSFPQDIGPIVKGDDFDVEPLSSWPAVAKELESIALGVETESRKAIAPETVHPYPSLDD